MTKQLTLADRYFLLAKAYRARVATLDELRTFRESSMIADGFCDSLETGWQSESIIFKDGSIYGASKNTWKSDAWYTSYMPL